MDWYCAVWNSDKVSSAAGAEFLYEQLCQGDDSLVGDISIVDEFEEDILGRNLKINLNKGKGFIIMSCDFSQAEKFGNLVQKLAKTHGLSYFEPQNMTYVF